MYDCDPMRFPEAKLHRALSYADVRAHNLAVMDETAITLCKVRCTKTCTYDDQLVECPMLFMRCRVTVPA